MRNEHSKKVSNPGKQIIRFDIEINDKQAEELQSLLDECFRSRKNFSEALVLLAIETFAKNETNIDLTRLGVRPNPKEVQHHG